MSKLNLTKYVLLCLFISNAVIAEASGMGSREEADPSRRSSTGTTSPSSAATGTTYKGDVRVPMQIPAGSKYSGKAISADVAKDICEEMAGEGQLENKEFKAVEGRAPNFICVFQDD